MSKKNYQKLTEQAEKLFRHNRQGSYKTRERYEKAFRRFVHYLTDVYRLQNLANISGKHLESYSEYMQYRNLSASTIKTDLSAIRFWHDQIANPRHRLPGNDAFNLERRKYKEHDRTWSHSEFDKMMSIAMYEDDHMHCLMIGRYAGLRIHEVMRLDAAQIRYAMKHRQFQIKGKNGKVRTVPIDNRLYCDLNEMIGDLTPGEKVFVPKGDYTHEQIKQLQKFIRDNRSRVQDKNSTRKPLTFHGLRHTYAAEQYLNCIKKGKTPYQARLYVSKLLGHERDDVTKVYLTGIQNDDKPESFWNDLKV